MGILDGAREFNSARIGTLAGGATAKAYFYIADDAVLTDIGFVDSVAVTANGTNYLTVAAYVGATKLVEINTNTGASASGLATNSTHVIAGLTVPLGQTVTVNGTAYTYFDGKATAAATATQADKALVLNLGSRFNVSDGITTGAAQSGVISTVKSEYGNLVTSGYGATGFGYTQLSGIRLPAGSTLELRAVNTATSPATFANLTLLANTRAGR